MYVNYIKYNKDLQELDSMIPNFEKTPEGGPLDK